MVLTVNLNRAFNTDNLQRAWLWTRTNSDAVYKSYFRHIYTAYSLTDNENLSNLQKHLINGTFKPTHATKIYLPKKSGILRPYSLLGIEDQVVYQSLINIIADQLYRRVRHRYYKSVFGHLYAGKNNLFFYRNWREGYKQFAETLIDNYEAGYKYTASFDLTACYDSIDHSVLKYFLRDIGFEQEFYDYLCRCLSTWTAHSDDRPIYQEHGIPQGPQPSGLLSECVLRYFDSNSKNNKVKYFRYVDDIRLLAKSEKELRKKLVDLDQQSKNIGLFPQSSKIDIHQIANIEDEIKSISHPPEILYREPEVNQSQVRMRLNELSPRYKVKNETRFKYILASAMPNADLQRRLIQILKKQPHLYFSIFNYLSKSTKLSRRVSEDCITLLQEYDLYATFTANLIKTLNHKIHNDSKNALLEISKRRLKSKNVELFSAAASVLLSNGKLNWTKTKNVLANKNWWSRSRLIKDIRKDIIGDPSYEALINNLLRDKVVDVALVAAEALISSNSTVRKPSKNIHKTAQTSLKHSGLIRRVSSLHCSVSSIILEVLGDRLKDINWRRIITKPRYKDFLRNVVRWRGYIATDATAWVNITDTMNDVILFSLYSHDSTIGSYNLGRIGSVLNSTGRLATNYPMMFMAVKTIHDKRLYTDLSHPIHKSTGKPTRYIEFKEIKPLKKLLVSGYLEMWQKW